MRLNPVLIVFLLPVLAPCQVWEKTIAPGVTYRMEIDPKGPRIIHGLRISPGSPDVAVLAELAGHTINEDGTVKGRLSPSQMLVDAKAVAAINGDFFNFSHGAPIGLMVRNGELITTPLKSRAVFGFGPTPSFNTITWTGKVGISGQDVPLEAVNQVASQNRITLATGAAGNLVLPTDATSAILTLVADKPGPFKRVTATVDYLITGSRTMVVADNQVVLIGRGTVANTVGNLRPGDLVPIDIKVQGFDWSKTSNAIGGGPFLLRNGTVSIDAAEEGFNAAFIARNPRSAVGVTPQGDIWFVAIDGRTAMSIGATIAEEAVVMQNLGCSDAINLDGGGSTLLNILGVTVNRPSDRAERPVSNGLMVLAPQVLATNVVPVRVLMPAKLVLGMTTEIKLVIGSDTIPQSEVIWGAQGAGWIDQGGLLRIIDAGKLSLTAYARGRLYSVSAMIDGKQMTPPPKVDIDHTP